MALPIPRRVNGLALCAGAGGLELGLHIAVPEYRTVCYVERDAYAAATLVARMADAALDDAPLWSDLKTFDGQPWRGKVDIITAGYPCQPFSQSGKRKGADDPRHLWPEVRRILRETEAPVLFAENVEGHVTLGLGQVRSDLFRMGYEVEAGIFSAAQVGASHIRKRLFILAYASEQGLRSVASDRDQRPQPNVQKSQLSIFPAPDSPDVDISMAPGGEGPPARIFPPLPDDFDAWERYLGASPDAQPAIFRADDGVAAQVDRLHLAGNGVLPLAAAYAFRTLAANIEKSLTATEECI